MMTFVYALCHRSSSMIYVGKTVHLKRRLKEHESALTDSYISRAVRKYGWNDFTVVILARNNDDEASRLEKEWIKILNTRWPNGYNLTAGGDGVTGLTEEARRKISESKRGKPASEEAKRKMSVSQRRRYLDPVERRRTGDAGRGNRCSERLRKKRSDALRLRWEDPVYRDTMSLLHKRENLSEETRARLSEGQRNRHIVDSDVEDWWKEFVRKLTGVSRG